jgi:hypothetical protein
MLFQAVLSGTKAQAQLGPLFTEILWMMLLAIDFTNYDMEQAKRA